MFILIDPIFNRNHYHRTIKMAIVQEIMYDSLFNYRPQRSWGKVMFLHVCVILFTGGGSAPLHAGIHRSSTGPEAAPPPSRTLGLDTPPSAVHAGRYGQQAGSTHPTGMQSCFFNRFTLMVHLLHHLFGSTKYTIYIHTTGHKIRQDSIPVGCVPLARPPQEGRCPGGGSL